MDPNNQYQPAPPSYIPPQSQSQTSTHPQTTDAHHTTPSAKKSGAFWEKAKHNSKAGFDKAWAGFEKLGGPVNKFTNKIGSEAFWPSGLGPESDKAARVLKSFCKDGFYKDASSSRPGTPSGPKTAPKVLVKIPQKVIQNCVGLAIFTVMRAGLWVSGAGGSGVLIARKEDGSWSPPSGILIHTLGVGFMAGIDIYDCVVVINNRKALEAFSKVRVSLGGELSVVAGPVGVGGVLESEVLKDRKPIWTYVKSRGLYGGLQIDGTIIVERNDENAKFYGERLSIGQILAGNVKHVPQDVRMLMEVVKSAEGRTDVDESVLQQADAMPPPGDVMVEKINEPTAEQKHSFAPPPGFEQAPQQPPRPVSGSGGAYAAASALHPQSAYQQPQSQQAGYQQAAYDPAHQQAGYQQPAYDQSSHLQTGNPQAAYQHPARTGSGFAPPPLVAAVHRTDSGFAPPPPGPPPGSSGLTSHPAPAQGKQDPDGPPRYA